MDEGRAYQAPFILEELLAVDGLLGDGKSFFLNGVATSKLPKLQE